MNILLIFILEYNYKANDPHEFNKQTKKEKYLSIMLCKELKYRILKK
jgi:hypothetical protein